MNWGIDSWFAIIAVILALAAFRRSGGQKALISSKEEISTKGVNIHSENGVLASRLNKDGLAFFDKTGMPRIIIGTLGRGAPYLVFKKPFTGDPFAFLMYDEESGNCQLKLGCGSAIQAESKILLNIDREGTPTICLYSQDGNECLKLRLNGHGKPIFDFKNDEFKGQIIKSDSVSAPIVYVRNNDGEIVFDETGNPVKADPTFIYAVQDMIQSIVKPECIKSVVAFTKSDLPV